MRPRDLLISLAKDTWIVAGGVLLLLIAVVYAAPLLNGGRMLVFSEFGTTVAWLLVVSGLYLLSPTQFPWYFTWLVPFLAIRAWPAIELYTITLPLYYFQHALRPGEARWWFDNIIIWVEHLPVFLAIVITCFLGSGSPLLYLKTSSDVVTKVWFRICFN